jgi:hypothetical protein
MYNFVGSSSYVSQKVKPKDVEELHSNSGQVGT